jgi:gamma-glutamyl-gamma-aminobutyraldehyde dehydrogenase
VQQEVIDQLRQQEVAPQKLFINGQWVSGTGSRHKVVSPIDGSVITSLPRASRADMQAAVGAARDAFNDGRWANLAPAARKQVLHKLADLIQEHALELAVLGVRDNGTEINMAIKAEPGSAASTFRYYAEAVDKVYGEIAPTDPAILGLVHKQPVGVVGAITPWNMPLMIGAWKIAPALAAGNSVVVKPAEEASLTTLRLAELAQQAGLPDGVLNVVTGKGSEVGEELAMSMDVDVLVFTGSGDTGRRLLEYSARSNMKRVYLELGGKSANIVFADAPDLDQAALGAAMAIFRNSGQICVSGSRLLVEQSIHDEFVSKVTEHAQALRIGDPLLLTSQVGAINNLNQLNGNLEFVSKAQAQGATLVTGGERILQATGGYYMQPTVMTGVQPDHHLAQAEVFGPVLAVMSFKDEAEAIAIANNSDYGLAGGIWTSNLGRAHRLIKAVKTGGLFVNTYGGADGTIPLGGVKQSGNGVDKTLHALDKYVDLKTAWIKL